MKRLLDRIVPPAALSWGPWAHMTKCWPWGPRRGGAMTVITCPACGHRAESHPIELDGSRTCSQALNDLPSCEECAAPLRALTVQQYGTHHSTEDRP